MGWFLIAYFFQKMFGATLFVNAGKAAIVNSILFDPWLLISTFVGTNIENSIYSLIDRQDMDNCLRQWDDEHILFDAMESILFAVNSVNICLWTMVAMSLSVGLCVDIIFTAVREMEYCVNADLEEKDSLWKKLTAHITKAIEAVDDAVDEKFEDAGLKEESSEDEHENHQSYELAVLQQDAMD